MKNLPRGVAAIAALCVLWALSGCASPGRIVQTAELRQSPARAVRSLLVVACSPFGASLALSGNEMGVGRAARAQLLARGLDATLVSLAPGETLAEVLKREVARRQPSHVLMLAVPRGDLFAELGSRQPTSVRNYTVDARLMDLQARVEAWRWQAEVSALPFGATPEEVAGAMLAKMAESGLVAVAPL
jgi:hypothetical protein